MEEKITCCGVLCQKVEIDEKTGFLSFIKIVSVLHVTIAPEELQHVGIRKRGIKAPLDFVLIWDRLNITNEAKKALTFECSIDFYDPTDTLIMTDMKLNVVIPEGFDRFYSVFNLSRGVITSRPGKHMLKVFVPNLQTGVSKVLCEQALYIDMVSAEGKPVDIPVL